MIALLTIPIYISSFFCRNLLSMMVVSAFLSIVFTIIGLAVSYQFDISSGPAIIMSSSLFALIIFILKSIKKMKLKRKKISILILKKSDGLVPVITQEYGSNEILMLGYMNKEALDLTVETKIVHYFSRSKNRIWKKKVKVVVIFKN